MRGFGDILLTAVRLHFLRLLEVRLHFLRLRLHSLRLLKMNAQKFDEVGGKSGPADDVVADGGTKAGCSCCARGGSVKPLCVHARGCVSWSVGACASTPRAVGTCASTPRAVGTCGYANTGVAS